MLITFPDAAPTSLDQVGGKGLSLIRLAQAQLPVPPGAVLTTAFFAPWFEEIQASRPWQRLLAAEPEAWAPLCDTLMQRCSSLPWTAMQARTLDTLRGTIDLLGASAMVAVRSSSPDEDLSTASFAGGYETCLGVRAATLEQAIRRCFASSLAERVLVYKRERGFELFSPRLAVVVQQQVDSEAAGVGFSLDPVTNDYDEAVIDANWGLGESVVSGRVTPDHFVVDKLSGRIVEKRLGAKQASIWLAPGGDTFQRDGYRSGALALDDGQVRELTAAIVRVEALYGMPIDIEWAYAGGCLHLLQARPITTYVPLSPEMLTRPGARRRLYSDISLASGLTINAPISPLGLDWMEELIHGLTQALLGAGGRCAVAQGDRSQDRSTVGKPGEKMILFAGGRMYQDLSSALWMASPERMAKANQDSDALMAAILANVDRAQYRSEQRPPWLGFDLLWRVPRSLWHLRGVLWNVAAALVTPARADRRYQRACTAFERALADGEEALLPAKGPRAQTAASPPQSLSALRAEHTQVHLRYIVRHDMAALSAALAALALVKRLAKSQDRSCREKLTRGFEGNVVVGMGLKLFGMAKHLGRAQLDDLPGLAERIESRQMSADFLRMWDAYLTHYGRRGPHEMDLASPRYADDIGLILWQMAAMPIEDPEFDPFVAHRRQVAERYEALDALLQRSGWLRRKLLQHAYRILDRFAGSRDTPKHHVLLCFRAVRKRVMIEGRRWAREGRIDDAEDVFGLTFGDLDRARADASYDLRAVREERLRFLLMLKDRVKQFPVVIDSRGRVLRPAPREEQEGTLVGLGVSSGVVRGPVKLLHHPHEKPVEKGDILVAFTTDPGWTPLFVNAAAVVLEIGGTLQHGVVVAREYGKPCVVGIEGVMTRLSEGQRVEVDGGTGVVRVLA